MSLYTRHQIVVLLAIVGVAGTGLAVGHWRRLHPEMVERIERLDRAPAADDVATPAAATPAAPTRPPRRPKLTVPDAGVAQGARPAAATPQAPLDLNTASAHELTQLPGVGPVLAERIVDARPYASVDDVRRVRGLGRSKLERLRDLVTVAER
jgi:competence ComEA-like helix-hairpin-helix protein